jgi:hypothetical protein
MQRDENATANIKKNGIICLVFLLGSTKPLHSSLWILGEGGVGVGATVFYQTILKNMKNIFRVIYQQF